jgi:hypothetical protein
MSEKIQVWDPDKEWDGETLEYVAGGSACA